MIGMRISDRTRRSGKGGILKLQILLGSGLTEKGRERGRAVLCRRRNMTGGGGRALPLGHKAQIYNNKRHQGGTSCTNQQTRFGGFFSLSNF